MSFANLTTEMQVILQVQYAFMFKAVLLFGSLFFALFYIFYWKRYQEQQTSLMTIGFLRIFLTLFSYTQMFLFPLSLVLLSPSYELATAQVVFFPVYLTFLTCGLILILADTFYFLPLIIIKKAGLDTGDPRVRRLEKSLNKYFKKNG